MSSALELGGNGLVVCFGSNGLVCANQATTVLYSVHCAVPIVVKSSSEAKLRANNTIARDVDVHGSSYTGAVAPQVQSTTHTHKI